MKISNFSHVLVACHATAFFCGMLAAAESPNSVAKLDKPTPLLVLAEQASVMVGDDPSQKVPRGTVLTATHRRGPWKYVPDRKGWVHEAEAAAVDEAVERCTKELQKSPSPEWHHLRGIAFMARREFVRAAQDLERAYDLGDSAVSLHLNMGFCYRALGQNAAALREFGSVIDAFPDEADAYIERGEILLEQGNYAAALSDFTKGVELRPNSAEALNNRGVALRLLGRYEEAIAAYTAAIAADPKFAEAFTNRGYALKSLGKDRAALENYETALKLDAKPATQNDLAWLLATSPEESLRDPNRALSLAKATCETTGNSNGEFLDTLAAAYAALGKFDTAVEAGALAVIRLEGNPGLKQVQARLELYRSGKAFIETDRTPEFPIAEESSTEAASTEAKSPEPPSQEAAAPSPPAAAPEQTTEANDANTPAGT